MKKRLMVVLHLVVLLSMLTGSMAAGPVSANPDDPTATPQVAQDGDGDGDEETTSPTLPRQRTRAADPEPDPDGPPAHRLRQARTDRVYGEPPNVDPTERALYIVRLADDPLSTYEGGVENLAATSPRATGRSKLNATSTAARNYRRYLEGEQGDFIQQVEQKLNRSVEVIYRYQVAFNGVSLMLTPVEAEALLEMPGVLLVERSREIVPTTSGTPEYLGLPAIWNHPELPTKGEGIIIGVIDTGIWPEHPSFADDGTYPDPPARWQGECVQPADGQNGYTCNNKLIGIRYFLDGLIAVAGGQYPGAFHSGRDDESHGTHVASTAAGNEGVPASIYGIDHGTVSGMAPRAHIASYKFAGPTGKGTIPDLLAALEAAVTDGVDIINYSFGSDVTTDPWADAQTLAFLNARAAGVFVATSAGNEGPGAGTMTLLSAAPWVTAVGNSYNHHLYLSDITVTITGTTTYTFTGATQTSGVSDYRLVSPPDVPEISGDEDWKCLQPFPAGTFESTDIVVCPHSILGGKSVLAGGAGAVLYTTSDTGYNTSLDPLPSVLVKGDEADAIKTLLNDHPGDVTVSFTPGERITAPDPRIPTNTVVTSSSRGPNINRNEGVFIDTLKPDLVAPGSHILAGTSPVQLTFAGGTIQPLFKQGELFEVKQGTSMSSPHVAGLAALLIAQHPDWTPAEVQSALLLTANDEHIMARTASGDVAATPFDMGAGIVRPTLAMTTGFVLNETLEGYQYANPARGGDPSGINLPSMVDSTCVGQCTWTRTIRSTLDQAVDWTVSYSETSNLSLSVTPETFTLEPGASMDLEITADVSGADFGAWLSGSLRLAPSDPTVAPAHMPVVARSARGEFPREETVWMMRDVGYQDISIPRVVGVSDLQRATSLGTPQKTTLNVTPDNNTDPSDDLTRGVAVAPVIVQPGTQVLVSEIISTTAQYVDLYVGRDTNGNQMPELEEVLCYGNYGDPRRCVIQGDKLQPGLYWVLVHNLQGSGSATDQVVVANTVAMPGGDGMTVEGPSSVADGDSLSLRLHWNLPGLDYEEKRYGTIVLGSDASNPDNLATILVELVREVDDVLYYPLSSDSYESRDGVSVDQSSFLQSGGHLTYVIDICPWNSSEDYTYILETTLPDALSYVEGSSSFPVTVNGQTLRWEMHTDSIWYDDIFSITYDVVLSDQARFPSTLAPELRHNTDQDGTVEETAIADPIALTGIALDISKTAPARVDKGGIYTYTLTVTNTGVVEASGLTVYDALPPAVQQHISGGTLSDDGMVEWTIETLAAGASTTVEFSVQAPSSVSVFEEPSTASDRIIGGDDAEPGEWPYTVALITASNPNAYDGQFCGGTLIQREWVLTAAHCIQETQPNDIDIVAGRQRLSSNEGQRIPVAQIIAHPKYDNATFDYDIALLRLSRPVAEDVPLVRMLDSRLPLAAPATMASVVGWGNMSVEDPQYPDMLQEVDVPIVDLEVCRTAAWDYGFALTDRMICAGPQEGGQDSCQGDSGGPLLVSDGSGGHQQVGVVSFGYNSCAQPDGYGVYASVPDLKFWVVDTINAFSDQVVNDHYGVVSDHGTSFARSTVPVTTRVENLPPDSVTITGATTGTVGVRQSFTATVAPDDATPPLAYTWSPEPDHGQGTPTATYDWFDPNASELLSGDQTVSVTVDNGEGSVSDAFTVNISSPVLTLESNQEEPAPAAPVYFTARVAPTSPHYDLVHFIPGDGHDPIVMKLKRNTGTWTVPYTYTEAGDYTAKAVLFVGADNLELASDTLDLSIAVDEPETLRLTASNTRIAADGVSTTTITAEATDIYLNLVPGMTVNFSTTAGVLSSSSATTENDGRARVTLTATDTPTTATVRAWMGDAATTSIKNSIAIAFVDTGTTTKTVSLDRVTIDGPHQGSTSITHTFTAIVSPTNATGPIEYTWSPEPVSGQGTAQAQYTFDTSGPSTLLMHATAHSRTVEAEHIFYANQSDIGAAGGTLEVFNASGDVIFRLDIPEGVLTEEHTFRFTERSAPAHPIGEGFTFTGRAFALDGYRGSSRLDSLVFGSPVGMQVTFDPTRVKDTGKLHLKRYDPDTQSWIDAAVGKTTVTGNTLSTTIDHLTEYAVFEASDTALAAKTVYLPVVQR